MMKKYKMTAIFIGCGQDGIDHWTNWYKTRSITLTDEQQKLLTPPEHMSLSQVIVEESEDEEG